MPRSGPWAPPSSSSTSAPPTGPRSTEATISQRHLRPGDTISIGATHRYEPPGPRPVLSRADHRARTTPRPPQAVPSSRSCTSSSLVSCGRSGPRSAPAPADGARSGRGRAHPRPAGRRCGKPDPVPAKRAASRPSARRDRRPAGGRAASGKRFELDVPELTFGRAAGCHVSVADDTSRRRCTPGCTWGRHVYRRRIWGRPTAPTSNGARLAGPTVLRPGDQVQVGNTVLEAS